MEKAYAFLHCHTEYSLKDSMANVMNVFEYAKSCGATAVAITEHGNMMSLFDADRAEKATGVKYIKGVESYIREDGEKKRRHLIIMAKDDAGYHALIKYVSETNTRLDVMKSTRTTYPCGNKEMLMRYFGKGSAGYGHVILTSACMAGVISTILLSNEEFKNDIRKEAEKAKSLRSEEDPEYVSALNRKESLDKEISDLMSKKKEKVKLSKKSFLKEKRRVEKLSKEADERTIKVLEEQLAEAEKTGEGTASIDSLISGKKKELENAKSALAILAEEKKALEEQLAEAEKAGEDAAAIDVTIADRKKELVSAKSALMILKKEVDRYNDAVSRIKELEAVLIPEETLVSHAEEEAKWYRDNFQYFFMEMQYHGIHEEAYVMPILAEIASRLSIPLVGANDSHMVDGTDDNVLARSLIRSTVFQRWEEPSDSDRQMYMKSDPELRFTLGRCLLKREYVDEAMKNIRVIADMCSCEVPNEEHHPKFFSTMGEEPEDAMDRLIYEGKQKIYGSAWTEEQEKQMEYERDMIKKMGFTDYFLNLVKLLPYAEMLGYVPADRVDEIPRNYWELEPWIKENGFDTGFGVGPGRGSAAGSLVCELESITKLNPQKYSLFFERFLNPERVSMPDIDTDIRTVTRQIFIGYIAQIFGQKSVSLIQTLQTLKAKEAIRTAARVLSVQKFGDGEGAKLYSVGDRIAKEIPADPHAVIADSLDSLKAKFTSDDEKKVIEYAQLLEGAKVNLGAHAAGIVIYDGNDLSDYIPMAVNVETGMWITQCDMVDVESRGLLKMDMLGLNTLDIITDTAQLVKERSGRHLTLDDFKDDPAVYADIANGDTDCVFQLSSEGMKGMLKGLKPNCMEDVIAGISLYRPGPMDYIPDYIKGKNNPEEIVYDTPKEKPILEATYGTIVYQEQVMQILQALAGYSLADADIVRRAMSKKKAAVIEAEEDVFVHGNKERGIQGCIANGIPEETARKIYDKMRDFAQYAFNKSHAAAYALDTYATAWLKHYYPLEFYTSMCNNKDADFIPTVKSELKRRGIGFATPDINKAFARFSIQDDKIVFGFATVKGVASAAGIIEEERKKGPYESVQDLMLRTGVSKDVVLNLIDAGAFDSIYPSREGIRNAVPEIMKAFSSYKSAKTAAMKKDEDDEKSDERVRNAKDVLLHATDMVSGGRISVEDLMKEAEVLGAYISGDPLDGFGAPSEYGCVPIASINRPSFRVHVFGVIENYRDFNTKTGARMAMFSLNDGTGKIHACCFPSTFEAVSESLAEGAVISVSAKAGFDRDGSTLQLIVNEVARLHQKQEPVTVAAKSADDWKTRVEPLVRCYTKENGVMLKDGLGLRVFLEDSGKFMSTPYFVTDDIRKDIIIFPRKSQ